MSRHSAHPPLETVLAADGTPLAARFHPPAGTARGAVLIVPAMGVGQDYYGDFAHWLAQAGYAVATFDYRGMGRSRRGSLRELKADILDWAALDCSAVLDALAERHPDLPLNWIGHSLGGQILPFCPQHTRLARAVTVGTGSGYWRENTWTLRSYVWWLWYVAVPLALPLCGYFPGRRLRKVGDLPRGVMAQWRRWCLHRDYAVGVEGETARRQFASVTVPIVSLSFTDDEYMSARNTESLHAFYTGARCTLRRIAPGDVGARRIGHFGFFRRRFAETLWRTYLLPALAADGDDRAG